MVVLIHLLREQSKQSLQSVANIDRLLSFSSLPRIPLSIFVFILDGIRSPLARRGSVPGERQGRRLFTGFFSPFDGKETMARTVRILHGRNRLTKDTPGSVCLADVLRRSAVCLLNKPIGDEEDFSFPNSCLDEKTSKAPHYHNTTSLPWSG